MSFGTFANLLAKIFKKLGILILIFVNLNNVATNIIQKDRFLKDLQQ